MVPEVRHVAAATEQVMAEPIELFPSRTKWWVMIIGGGAFAAGILVNFSGSTVAMSIAALTGCFAAVGAIMLLPGANALRLDAQEFQVVHFFASKRFRWSEVSDFGVCSLGQSGDVVAFKASAARLNMWEKVNGALLGDRNAYLPDTYGMTAEDLAHLMTVRLDIANKQRQD